VERRDGGHAVWRIVAEMIPLASTTVLLDSVSVTSGPVAPPPGTFALAIVALKTRRNNGNAIVEIIGLIGLLDGRDIAELQEVESRMCRYFFARALATACSKVIASQIFADDFAIAVQQIRWRGCSGYRI
jgi:hypothetical protein